MNAADCARRSLAASGVGRAACAPVLAAARSGVANLLLAARAAASPPSVRVALLYRAAEDFTQAFGIASHWDDEPPTRPRFSRAAAQAALAALHALSDDPLRQPATDVLADLAMALDQAMTLLCAAACRAGRSGDPALAQDLIAGVIRPLVDALAEVGATRVSALVRLPGEGADATRDLDLLANLLGGMARRHPDLRPLARAAEGAARLRIA